MLHGATLSREEAGNVAVNAAKKELTRLIMKSYRLTSGRTRCS